MVVFYIAGMTPPSSPSAGRAGRPREFAIDDALDRAIGHFSAHGYHGTSITDLRRVLGLTAGSIYKAWGDKRGLFLAALDRYIDGRGAEIAARLAEAANGRAKVAALLSLYAELSSGESGRTGCLVVEMAMELSSADPDIARRVAAQQRHREAQMAGLIAEGQRDRSISPACDAGVIAALLVTLTQGMRVAGKAGVSRAHMQSLIDQAMRLLD